MSLRGFPSEGERDSAQAIVDELAQFPGAGAALQDAQAWMGQLPDAAVSPGRAEIPASMLRDLAAGAGGRVGAALLRAAARSKAAPTLAKPVFDKPRAMEPDDEPEPPRAFSSRPAWQSQGAPERAPKPLIDEGEGSDSLDAMVRRLEDGGFGGTSTATVNANRAKTRTPRRD
jgi:hypothetical protein